jgi:hypothetical protein
MEKVLQILTTIQSNPYFESAAIFVSSSVDITAWPASAGIVGIAVGVALNFELLCWVDDPVIRDNTIEIQLTGNVS